ncbi:hypothetical protein KIPB_014281, partial [Kipferlia bialata]|eukprot:g14281.t1
MTSLSRPTADLEARAEECIPS